MKMTKIDDWKTYKNLRMKYEIDDWKTYKNLRMKNDRIKKLSEEQKIQLYEDYWEYRMSKIGNMMMEYIFWGNGGMRK